LVEASQNPILKATMEHLSRRIDGSLWMAMRKHNFQGDASRVRHYALDQHTIFAAICESDALLFQKETRRQLMRIRNNLGDFAVAPLADVIREH
jgi:DNA-binding GntR family transcriptional regulator